MSVCFFSFFLSFCPPSLQDRELLEACDFSRCATAPWFTSSNACVFAVMIIFREEFPLCVYAGSYFFATGTHRRCAYYGVLIYVIIRPSSSVNVKRAKGCQIVYTSTLVDLVVD